MQYKIITMQFPAGVHFGQRNLEDAGYELYADTIFSALCNEIVQDGEEVLNWFVNTAKEGKLLFSDAFPFTKKRSKPFMKERYYLPKPLKRIERKETDGSSTAKKIWKKVTYLNYEDLENYLSGDMTEDDAKENLEDFKHFGKAEVRTQADLQTKEEATPYRVGSFHFNSEYCGLYFIVGYEKDEDYKKVLSYIQALSYTGIGGRRSSGFGRFTATAKEVPDSLKKRIGTDSKNCMSLSVALPRDEELDAVLPNAEVLWVKRSGFVTSLADTDTYRRRRDLYVMKAGSCVETTFDGDIYDVRNEVNRHPVYRYAKPMWLEV